ncbi:MAG: hypothetical protein M3552_11015, partial [Planctomycetota bacterium]|nr:hypothetical protein [Planctomycetota bacterium]
AGVHKDLPGGQTYLGAPAAPIADATRAAMAMQKLPQLRQTLRQLERQVEALQKKVDDAAGRERSTA